MGRWENDYLNPAKSNREDTYIKTMQKNEGRYVLSFVILHYFFIQLLHEFKTFHGLEQLAYG